MSPYTYIHIHIYIYIYVYIYTHMYLQYIYIYTNMHLFPSTNYQVGVHETSREIPKSFIHSSTDSNAKHDLGFRSRELTVRFGVWKFEAENESLSVQVPKNRIFSKYPSYYSSSEQSLNRRFTVWAFRAQGSGKRKENRAYDLIYSGLWD